MDPTTWIKDDGLEEWKRVYTMKLNADLKFQTGVYPYSVMTSVFSPVDRYRDERFQPVKVVLTSQEWCGQVFHGLWPAPGEALENRISYFAEEGHSRRVVDVPEGALYEDALLIQLREIDGPFHGGKDWRGPLVPSLWRLRKTHEDLAAVDATITREQAERDGAPVNRFTVKAGDFTWTIDVEREGARRILGWTTSDGDVVELLETARMPYWRLNGPGDEEERKRIGMPVEMWPE